MSRSGNLADAIETTDDPIRIFAWNRSDLISKIQ
jgi:hypothetical protein